MRRRLIGALGLVGLVLVGALTPAVLDAQGSISAQVLRLLTRDNHWTGTQTFDQTVGVTLESGLTPPVLTANTLYNLGGNLWFNGVLVATSAGAGTVTSVGLAAPAIFTVSGSPVVAAGTLTLTLATQTENTVWAGPATAPAAAPTFRTLVAADLPLVPASGLTGVVPVANGGTGIASGTDGGILGFTASGTIASSVVLTANRIVLGGGAGATPTVVGSLGSTTTVLHGNAAGAPTFAAVNLTTTVTGTLPVGNGGTGLTAGTSGGVPFFNSTSTMASSAVLTQNRLVLGGGAGAAPTVVGSLGTTTTLLHGNAAGAPTFGAVVLTADVTGTLPVTNGGTGLATYTQGDLIYASAATTLVALPKNATATRYLSNTGASNNPAWAAVNLANGVTGTLPVANGGTATATVPTNGQLLIGDGVGYTVATLTGTASQVIITNGAGTITLSLPQSIDTPDTPQWARIGLGTGAGASAALTTTGQFDLGFFDNGNCGTADTVDWDAGQVQTALLTAISCTLTFVNPVNGATYRLLVVQDGTGSRLVSWPALVQWAGGSAPTLSTTPGLTDVCTFTFDGTNYQGTCSTGVTSATLQATSVTLTNAQILALPTTPITIVPAPGASNRIVFVGADLRTSLAVAYANVDTTAFLYVGWTGQQASDDITNEGASVDLDDFLTDAVSTGWLAPNRVNGTANPHALGYASAFLNSPIVIQANNAAAGDFTGGNAANTITVTVYYFIR